VACERALGDKKPVRDALRRALHYAEQNKISFGDLSIDVDPLDVM
jgi:hypothetical protein